MVYGLGRSYYIVRAGIVVLHERMKRLNPLGFTHDEYLALFAPKEHWEPLKLGAEMSTSGASGGRHYGSLKHGTLTGELAEIVFDVAADGAPLMPRNTAVLMNAPKELLYRLVTWANREIEVGLQFAAAAALMDWLNVNCATKDQMRFLWPSVVTLCGMNECTADLTERLREFKAPKHLPAIPAEVKAACRMTSGIIAGASLLVEEPDTFTAQVKCSMKASSAMTHNGALGVLRPFDWA
jgi:hypothetical protein